MAITFINASSTGVGSVIVFPPHQEGDLLVVAAINWSDQSSPDLPPGFTGILTETEGISGAGLRLGYMFAVGFLETNWPGADAVICHVYRGVNPDDPIGTIRADSDETNSISYSYLSPNEPETSWQVGFAFHRRNEGEISTREGFTRRIEEYTDTDSNIGEDSASPRATDGFIRWPSNTVNVSGSDIGWIAVQLEIKEDLGLVSDPDFLPPPPPGQFVSEWYSNQDELDILNRVERNSNATQADRFTVDILGESVQNRLIHLVRYGNPVPEPTDRTIFITGAIHGNEPAGRQGILEYIKFLNSAGPFLQLSNDPEDFSSTNDEPLELDLTNALDLRIDAALNDWKPTGIDVYLVSKYSFATDQDKAYALRISGGELQLVFSDDGSTDTVAASGVTDLGLPGERLVYRGTLAINDETGEWEAKFYRGDSVDGPWELIGNTATGTLAGAKLWNSAVSLRVGSAAGSTFSIGPARVFNAQVRSGIEGPIVAFPNFENQQVGNDTSLTDSTGKVWFLNGDAEINSDLSSAQRTFMDDHGIMFVPTVNPDGFLSGQSGNADGVDVSRDFIRLVSPEARVVSQALAAARPIVVWDMEEYVPVPGDQQKVRVGNASPAQAHSTVVSKAGELRDELISEIDSQGLSASTWNKERGNVTVFDVSAALRHSISGISRTNRYNDEVEARLTRSHMHFDMIDEIINFVIDEGMTALTTLVTSAAGAKTVEGNTATEPFDLLTGGTIDPVPVAYDVSSSIVSVLELYRSIWNIDPVINGRISMTQPAQPIIPYLMDINSPYRVVTGTRVFDIQSPEGVPTVGALSKIVSGSFSFIVEAKVIGAGEHPVGPDPSGTTIEVLGGDVSYDGTGEVFGTLELETPGIDENLVSMFPRRHTDLLSIFGNEIFVRYGIELHETVLWVPLGYFRINSVEQGASTDHPLRIAASDRMSTIVDSNLISPVQIDKNTKIRQAFKELITPIYPRVDIVFDDDSGDKPVGRDIVVEEDRFDALLNMAKAIGKNIYFDGEGRLRVESLPDPDEIVWTLKAVEESLLSKPPPERTGALISAPREITREDMANGIIVRGEGSTEKPIQIVIIDEGKNSPTRWGGPFGKIPKEHTSPLITDQVSARLAGEELLRKHIGLPYQITFTSVTNPGLRPWHAIRLVLLNGIREKHVMEKCVISLTPGAMRGSTKEQQNLQIGQLP